MKLVEAARGVMLGLVCLISAPLAQADKFTTPHASGMCLGKSGSQVVLVNCGSAPDIQFSGYGQVKADGQCLSASAEKQPLAWTGCSNTAAQKWALSGRLNNEQGLCADIKGEARAAGTPILGWSCTGKSNQQWAKAVSAATPVATAPAAPTSPPLVIDLRQARYNATGSDSYDIYSADGKVALGKVQGGNFYPASLVASGGGNLVASGGGNLVASGGGNVILPNGSQVPLVASGGGNLVAAGGGNLVASGGGNFTAGTPAANIIAAGLNMNPPVSPLSGRTVLGANDFNTLKTRSTVQSAPPVAAVQQPAARTSGQGTFVNQQNNRCMDVPNGNVQNGVQLVVHDCNGAAGQRFTQDNGFLKSGGKCVAAFDDSARGARVGIWDCVEHPSQKWTLQSDGHMHGPNNYCIGVNGASTSDGAPLILWDCESAPNQQWRSGALGIIAVPQA